MRSRLLPLLLPLAVLTAGCADARDAASTVTDCAALAGDVARSGLSGVPTQAEAEQAVRRLDDRIDGLDSPDVREAATALRDRLRDLQEAARSADGAAAAQAAEEARAAARRTAETCGVPADQFLGG